MSDSHSLNISWSGEGSDLLSEILSSRGKADAVVPTGTAPQYVPAVPRPVSMGPAGLPSDREPTRKEWLDAGWSPSMPGQPPPTMAFVRASQALPQETPFDAITGLPFPQADNNLPPEDRSKAEQKERLTRVKKRSSGGVVRLNLDLYPMSVISVDNRVMDPSLAVVIQVNVVDKERMATHLRALADLLA